jgi:hypothetical protein
MATLRYRSRPPLFVDCRWVAAENAERPNNGMHQSGRWS